ncbi:MAG TPA: KUP/HAK/KT family potassium transporter [Rariglobus sp.]|nr:KUP/HAK/KT family potassium transporter [Rariglobus sp.]
MNSAPADSSVKTPVKIGLCLGALGIVFGDIGTSPLYTMKECLHYLPDVDKTEGVLGILSLMFWALVFEVCFKYISFVMRADNRGEGGIFALLALSHKGPDSGGTGIKRGLGIGTIVILVGAALLFGDGVITPAISVLGAAEGFVTFNPGFEKYVVPTAVIILAGLFFMQSKGTDVIGKLFGPVMLVWFFVLGALGFTHLFDSFEVFYALNPMHGFKLLWNHPAQAAAVLGGIVLTITGAEALYADMGHFGRRAIVRAWYFVVFPGLLLNYFGQGAYAISHPDDKTNPFFALAPDGPLRVGLVILSIMAAIIASQALISGTFSLTRQAIQLGYFPRLKILHTNAEHEGQIYVPLMNFLLAVGSIAVVIGFGSSSRLAAAYGIAVTGTMAVTTYAFFRVTRLNWKWPLFGALALCVSFMAFDLVFFSSNLHKIVDGGWLPLAMAVAVLAVMHTWKSGRNEIQEKVYGGAITELELSHVAKSKNIVRVPGSAVFMVATPKGTPLALLHHLKANKCLQQTVVLLTIGTVEVPSVDEEERMTLECMGEGVWRAVGRYGYMESPSVNKLVERIRAQGVPITPQGTTYYFNREMIITGGNARMFEWQKSLYAFLSRNARPVKDYYQILPTQIIEIGLPVQL